MKFVKNASNPTHVCEVWLNETRRLYFNFFSLSQRDLRHKILKGALLRKSGNFKRSIFFVLVTQESHKNYHKEEHNNFNVLVYNLSA